MRYKKAVCDLEIADVDVGGDIHRIILGGINNPSDAGAIGSREKIYREYDALRRLLISHPYGNEDMCADFLFDSRHAEAAHGYVIMECMGYPYFSGSNTIATVAALLEYGRIPFTEGRSELKLESPGGIVSAQYLIEGEYIREVTINGGAAYVIADNETLDVPGYGAVDYALVWSGAYFVLVDGTQLDITLDKASFAAMKQAGNAIIQKMAEDFSYQHQDYGAIDPPGFVHFTGAWEETGENRYRGYGATYGYPATVFYCPTGTGTSARMALETARGEFGDEAVLEYISAAGNRFTGRALGRERKGNYDALATNITARPFVLASTRMHIDFNNPQMQEFAELKSILQAPPPRQV